jgi:hypothetical protein
MLGPSFLLPTFQTATATVENFDMRENAKMNIGDIGARGD